VTAVVLDASLAFEVPLATLDVDLRQRLAVAYPTVAVHPKAVLRQ